MGALTNLTPFRHHGLYRYRRLQSALQRYKIECSTPFDITDYIGAATAPARCACARCAQRLSASRIISGGGRGAPGRRRLSVLNAFRHHGLYRTEVSTADDATRVRCSTPFGITDYIGGDRRRGGHGHRLGCSTPFGITDYIGRSYGGCTVRGVRVLNAFRHHGLYRAVPYQIARHRRHVLNAFRHHGLYRLALFDALPEWPDVLNAFRHHGLYRVDAATGSLVMAKKCSTPFGITDYIGRRA